MATQPKTRRRNREQSNTSEPVAIIDLTADTPSPATRQARRRLTRLPERRPFQRIDDTLPYLERTNIHLRHYQDLLNESLNSLRSLQHPHEIDDEIRNQAQTDLKEKIARQAIILRDQLIESGMSVPPDIEALIAADYGVLSTNEEQVSHTNNNLTVTPSELTCPICLDDLRSRKPMSTKCGHLFCEQCIENALLTRKKCPKCNNAITRKSCIRLFF